MLPVIWKRLMKIILYVIINISFNIIFTANMACCGFQSTKMTHKYFKDSCFEDSQSNLNKALVLKWHI